MMDCAVFKAFLQHRNIYVATAGAPIHDFQYSAQYFLSLWLLSNMAIIETMVSVERGKNPVAMTNINPRK